MAQEYYSFNDVLRELQIEREQLQRLIEEGDIVAHRDGKNLKFLKEDIEHLKNTKMDQPTITVQHSDGDVVLIEEIKDEEEKAPQAKAPKKAELRPPTPPAPEAEAEGEPSAEPLFSMTKSAAMKEQPNERENAPESAEAEIEEGEKPLLEISGNNSQELLTFASEKDKGASSPPLLNISPKEKKTSKTGSQEKTYEALKAETEELVFEHESGEDLLDTGELLFESKEQILPLDKELDELIPDSEAKVSPFDSKVNAQEEKAIEDAWDLAEESGEDIVSTNQPLQGRSLAIDESKRRKKTKTVSSLVAGVLAFLVLAIFILKPNPSDENVKIKVLVYQAQEMPIHQQYSFYKSLESAKFITITAPEPGILEGTVPIDKPVRKGTPLAYLVTRQDTGTLEKELQKQQNLHQETLVQKNIIQEWKDSFYRWQKSKSAQDKRIYDQNAERYGKLRKGFEKEIPKDSKQPVASFITKLLNVRETEAKNRVDSLKKIIENQILSNKIPIGAPEDGIVKKWETGPGTEITTSGKALCDFAFTSTMQVQFNIPENKALAWNKGERIPLKYGEKEITGIIDKIYQASADIKPITLTIDVKVENSENALMPGMPVIFAYQKQTQEFVIPRESIIRDAEGIFIFLVKDRKLFKYSVQVEESAGDLVPIKSSILKGDQVVRRVVSPQKELKDLKEGQTVIIQSEN